MINDSPEVNLDELVNLTQSLIGFPNVNPPGDDLEITNFLTKYLQDLGLDVRCDDLGSGHHNVVATWRGEAPGPVLLLTGHHDVVETGHGWSVDPFSGTIKDGYLIGRGAVDMKSGMAALIMAVKALKNSKFPLKGTIILALVADQEISQHGSKALAKQGLTADYALVAEPSSMIPVIAHHGRRIYELSSIGKTAHAVLPEQGINAIVPMLDFIQNILKKSSNFSKKSHPLLGRSTFVLTTIQGGNAINSVPDRCTATIDFRHIPNHDHREVDQEIQIALDEVANRHTQADLDWKVLFSAPSFECAEDMPLVKSLRRSAQLINGRDPGVKAMHAATDAGIFSNTMGIPTVVCGPGDHGQVHLPDEKILVEELHQGARIYTHVIQDLMHI